MLIRYFHVANQRNDNTGRETFLDVIKDVWITGNSGFNKKHDSTVQYSTVQYSTVQYNTVQYSTVQYSAVQYSTVQYKLLARKTII